MNLGFTETLKSILFPIITSDLRQERVQERPTYNLFKFQLYGLTHKTLIRTKNESTLTVLAIRWNPQLKII